MATEDTIDPRELQALQHYLAEYGQQAEVFSHQLQILEDGRMEAMAAIEALKGIRSGENEMVLLQLGGGVSVKARVIEPEKILVNIGSEVVIEKGNAVAAEFLQDRITEMEASGKKVVETLERIRAQMNEITRRIEIAYQQSQGPGSQS
jgi:prefoldin alpha subunit